MVFQEAGLDGGAPPMTPTDIEVNSLSFISHDAPCFTPSSSLSHSTSQALETKVVSEENSGNCPVCVEPFQIGDQVDESSGARFEKQSCFQLLLPGCLASHLHGCHPDCLHGWLTRW